MAGMVVAEGRPVLGSTSGTVGGADIGVDMGGVEITELVGTPESTAVVVAVAGAFIAATICSKLRSFVK